MELKPFLRWAGGKFRLVDILAEYVPQEIATYYEPFLGGGAVFFKMEHQKRSVLSDLNPALIQCYKGIQENPEEVNKYLGKLLPSHSEENYYKYRDYFNKNNLPNCEKSAIFIYLNKTCFNGVYRVNNQNYFNVPYGKILNPAIPTLENLKMISQRLQNVELYCCDYNEIIDRITREDFIYLDPPYPPLNDTAKFVEYTKHKFSFKDQEQVATFANKLRSTGCNVMISNADTPNIRELYKDWNIHTTTTTRTISCKKERYSIQELIITNY